MGNKGVVLLVLFCFAYGFTLSVSESNSTPLNPHVAESFSLGYIKMRSAENCSYLVVISTSCSSPKFTTDEISIAFGDARGNQVYAARLNDPLSGTFEQCSSDSFQIDGPCASDICYVYLRRSGKSDDENDGWKPESVKVYGITSEPVTYYFNTTIPNDKWYGYNTCEKPTPPSPPSPPSPHPPTPSSSYKLPTPIFMLVGFVIASFWV